MLSDAFQPFRSGNAIVIKENKPFACGGAGTAVAIGSRALFWSGDRSVKKWREIADHFGSVEFSTIVADDNFDNALGEFRAALLESCEAAAKGVRPVTGRNDDR
jgi:hypothetical protein